MSILAFRVLQGTVLACTTREDQGEWFILTHHVHDPGRMPIFALPLINQDGLTGTKNLCGAVVEYDLGLRLVEGPFRPID